MWMNQEDNAEEMALAAWPVRGTRRCSTHDGPCYAVTSELPAPPKDIT